MSFLCINVYLKLLKGFRKKLTLSILYSFSIRFYCVANYHKLSVLKHHV